MSTLISEERPAAGEPSGLLVLHHGRGTDEHDLLGLADALDPARMLHIVTPRAPLQLPGAPGYHWYVVPRVGYPDPVTFAAAYRTLADFHDELWRSTGIKAAQTVLGGFSMGSAMSYALALGADRPPPAGILAFSGFIPNVPGWEPTFGARRDTRAFVAHGRNDPLIPVGLARAAVETLEGGGLAVEYRESDAPHQIDPADIAAASSWLARTVSQSSAPP
jgi:phospholipase/carboxylesterase